VVFTRPNFSEAAFARFKLVDGKGCSLVYSHRIYGDKAADEMSAWIKSSGDQIETALMEWTSMPSPAQLHRERL
jgi:riboflavin synthase